MDNDFKLHFISECSYYLKENVMCNRRVVKKEERKIIDKQIYLTIFTST